MNNRTGIRDDSSGVGQPPELLAVHDGGPLALAELLGDQLHVLQQLALDPGELFTVDGPVSRDHRSTAYAQIVDSLYQLRCALDALDARSAVALSEATTRERIAEARDRAAHEDRAMPSETVIGQDAERIARQSLAMSTRRSPAAASQSLACARRLVTSMPGMLAALATGRVDPSDATASARAAGPLDHTERRRFDRELTELLPELDGAGRERWRHARKTLMHRIAPDRSDIRHQKERKNRHVSLHANEHGMATLTAYLPAVDAKIVHKRLSLEAERLRAEGDRKGHSALMADCLIDTLLGRELGMDPVRLELGIIITDRSLIDPAQGEVAHVEGYGPVPAELVREQLRASLTEPAEADDDPWGRDGPEIRAMFRRLYTHPVTGELVAIESRSRTFPRAMARFLSWRDTICRGPHCNAVIRQTDHIVPRSRGGVTSIDNGQGLCAHCNAKELHSRRVARIDGAGSDDTGHRVEWTSRTGTTRVTTPTRFTPATSSEGDQAIASEKAAIEPPEAEPAEPPTADPQPGSTTSALFASADPLALLRTPVVLGAIASPSTDPCPDSGIEDERVVPVPATVLDGIEFVNPGNIPCEDLPADPLPADATFIRSWRFVAAA